MTIAASTRMGAVELSVADLERSIAYYAGDIGLRALDRQADRAVLGAGTEPLVALVEQRGAPPADGYPGLFHFALLVPERADLARFLAHAIRERVTLTGLSDHAVSEALYLYDPDHHGIEIYADRPRAEWEDHVGERLGTWPLDVNALLAELADPATEPFDVLPTGTTMGHVHLRVLDVAESVAFYRDVIGFELMARLGGQAAFLGAGGYHHHVGANVWETAHPRPAPDDHARLLHATVVLPDDDERARVIARAAAAGHATERTDAGPLLRDPAGNGLLLAV